MLLMSSCDRKEQVREVSSFAQCWRAISDAWVSEVDLYNRLLARRPDVASVDTSF